MDDEHCDPHFNTIQNAELAVIKCQPATMTGLADKMICLMQLDIRYDGFPSYEEAAAFSGSHDTPALFIAIGRDAQALGSFAMSGARRP
jgi:aspartyl aminopeptidase